MSSRRLTESDGTSTRSPIEEVERAASDFLSAAGAETIALQFGPVGIDLSIPPGAFADSIMPAIDHARIERHPQERADAISVMAADFDGPGPEEFRRLEDLMLGDGNFSYLTGEDGFHGLWQPDSRTLETIDTAGNRALYLTGSSASIATWELAAPLRRLIHWSSLDASRLIVHAAALQFEGVGLLLTGLSGAGKSTTSARLIDAGFASAGDDMVLVDLDCPRPVAHALFDVLKISRESREGLSFVDRVEWREIDPFDGKKRCPISAIRPGAFLRSLELHAILLPTITGEKDSAIVPAGAAEAARAMVPSTLQILRGGERQTLPKMARLSQRLDCHRLLLGTDREGIAATLRSFCRERVQ